MSVLFEKRVWQQWDSEENETSAEKIMYTAEVILEVMSLSCFLPAVALLQGFNFTGYILAILGNQCIVSIYLAISWNIHVEREQGLFQKMLLIGDKEKLQNCLNNQTEFQCFLPSNITYRLRERIQMGQQLCLDYEHIYSNYMVASAEDCSLLKNYKKNECCLEQDVSPFTNIFLNILQRSVTLSVYYEQQELRYVDMCMETGENN